MTQITDQEIREMAIRVEALCNYVMSLQSLERMNEKINELRSRQEG